MALTCHCLMPAGQPSDKLLAQFANQLKERFRIGRVTIQIEVNEEFAFALEPDNVV